jgi:hypothetical protein
MSILAKAEETEKDDVYSTCTKAKDDDYLNIMKR